MFGQILGGIAGGAAKIFGSRAMGKALKSVRENIEQGKRDSEDDLASAKYGDYTQRADAVAALTKTREMINGALANNAGASAVMGGSNASRQAMAESMAGAIASAGSNIAANAEASRRSDINAAQARIDNANKQLNEITQKQGENAQQAWNVAADALSQTGDALSGQFSGKFGKLI